MKKDKRLRKQKWRETQEEAAKPTPGEMSAHSLQSGLGTPTPRSSGVSYLEKAYIHDKNECRLLIKKNSF